MSRPARAGARGLIGAIQLLTRIPVGRADTGGRDDLEAAADWAPLVGLLIGALVAAAAALLVPVDAQLAALFGAAVWIAVTGAVHADGLADLADGLAAAHGDRGRLLEAMRDPRVGSFGALALVGLVVGKLVLLAVLLRADRAGAVLVLAPAWARLGAVYWSRVLPPLAPGLGSAFAPRRGSRVPELWLAGLLLASAAFAPPLLAAPALFWLIASFLRRRVGGMNGDCLGAGIESSELALLLLAGLIHAG